MKKFVLLQFLFFISFARGFTNVYPKPKYYPLFHGEDAGIPLFLTPLIENGKIDEARNKAVIQHKEMNAISSYAGFLTVNKKYNSNMFFWFFPALHDPKIAPVVLWLQGGPGATSMYGLFLENGPFIVTKNKTLKMREYSWNKCHNLLYIDNPVGTGFSFTEDEKGYATNETHVGRDVHTALVQFFELFPELQTNDFYVTGESYGGKYVPAVSHAIKDYNIKAKVKINLKGLAIGNGLTDPVNQLDYGDYLYQLGLLDANGRDLFQKYEEQGKNLIKQEKWLEAFDLFDELLDGDITQQPSLFKNLTGFDYYFNYLYKKDPSNESDYMVEWLQRADVRKAIHVGNRTFIPESKKVETYMKADVMQSLAILIADLTQHYRILIYNGQLDIIVAYPLTENYLQKLKWPGAEKYKTAQRKVWFVGNELAGYSKSVDNLTEVLVRNAGHMVPLDQPKWALDLITRFTKMAILTYVYIFAVLFIANSMQAYVPCDGKPAPTNVKILGCDNLPCNLVRGTNVEANVDFKAVANTKTLKPVVDVDLGNSHLQYPLPEQNACKNLVSGQCPLQNGQAATYYLKMPVLKSYPKVALTIQLSLVDENNNSQVCFKIPAKVVD